MLNIHIEANGARKMFRFSRDESVYEVIKSVTEKIDIDGDLKDLGLFQPPTSSSAGRWLRKEKTLTYYDLKSQDLLVLKKLMRPLKVHLLDGTVKTVMIDDSLTVAELVDRIGEKLALSNPEEYSMARAGDQWLNGEQSLYEQGVTEGDVLVVHKATSG